MLAVLLQTIKILLYLHPVGHKELEEAAFLSYITHCLLIEEESVIRQLQKCTTHSLPIGHRSSYNNDHLSEMNNFTHFLFIMGEDMIRTAFQNDRRWCTHSSSQDVFHKVQKST